MTEHLIEKAGLTESQIEMIATAVHVGGSRGYDFTEFPDLVPTVERIIVAHDAAAKAECASRVIAAYDAGASSSTPEGSQS